MTTSAFSLTIRSTRGWTTTVNPGTANGRTSTADSSDDGVFQSAAWQQVVSRTYGHELCPVRVERDGRSVTVPFALVNSPFTGRRLVSFPYSDFVPLSLRDEAEFKALLDRASEVVRERRCAYLELRSSVPMKDAVPYTLFLRHTLNLQQAESALWNQLASSFRRAIRVAERNEVAVEFDDTPASVREYYRLHCITRKRHGAPPQSLRFFEILHEELIGKGGGLVALARVPGHREAISGAVFLWQGDQAVYKFGGSDPAWQQVRPNNLLMWRSALHLQTLHKTELNLGRTEPSQAGLAHFKRGLGGVESTVPYYRFDPETRPCRPPEPARPGGWREHARRVMTRLPVPVLRGLGQLMYSHVH